MIVFFQKYSQSFPKYTKIIVHIYSIPFRTICPRREKKTGKHQIIWIDCPRATGSGIRSKHPVGEASLPNNLLAKSNIQIQIMQ